MFLESINSAFPPNSFTQEDCLAIIRHSSAVSRLKPRSVSLLEKILSGDSGIQKRHFAAKDPSVLFDCNAEELNQRFERAAPKLGCEALIPALEKAGLVSENLDGLFICTCTGYLCPGISSHVAEKLGMRPNVYLNDMVGQGCGAAIPTLRAAQGFLAANANSRVAVVAVEICSAAFYMDNDPGVDRKSVV